MPAAVTVASPPAPRSLLDPLHRSLPTAQRCLLSPSYRPGPETRRRQKGPAPNALVGRGGTHRVPQS